MDAMSSPLPRMAPHLEQHWRVVHTSLIVYPRDQWQKRLPSDLPARVEAGGAIDDGKIQDRGVHPDVRVVDAPSVDSTAGGQDWPIAVTSPKRCLAHTLQRVPISLYAPPISTSPGHINC
jgi:hypothetical protein